VPNSQTAQEIIDRTDNLANLKMGFEPYLSGRGRFFLPTSSRETREGSFGITGRGYDRLVDRPSTAEGSRRLFDSTGISALDRLAAGMESLVAPQSEKWHEQG
jgi:hypothetical protein